MKIKSLVTCVLLSGLSYYPTQSFADKTKIEQENTQLANTLAEHLREGNEKPLWREQKKGRFSKYSAITHYNDQELSVKVEAKEKRGFMKAITYTLRLTDKKDKSGKYGSIDRVEVSYKDKTGEEPIGDSVSFELPFPTDNLSKNQLHLYEHFNLIYSQMLEWAVSGRVTSKESFGDVQHIYSDAVAEKQEKPAEKQEKIEKAKKFFKGRGVTIDEQSIELFLQSLN
jgi:hypothetical protein